MSAITHDELQCEATSLGRWVSDLIGRPFWVVGVQALGLAERAIAVAKSTKDCLYACPQLDSDKSCLLNTIKAANFLADNFRHLALGSRIFNFVAGKKLKMAAEAWDDIAEYAEDIRDMIEAEKDQSASIPWFKVKAELGL